MFLVHRHQLAESRICGNARQVQRTSIAVPEQGDCLPTTTLDSAHGTVIQNAENPTGLVWFPMRLRRTFNLAQIAALRAGLPQIEHSAESDLTEAFTTASGRGRERRAVTLTDAGPLIAIIDSDEPDHDACLEPLDQVAVPLITTWPAFAEASSLLARAGGHHGRRTSSLAARAYVRAASSLQTFRRLPLIGARA